MTTKSSEYPISVSESIELVKFDTPGISVCHRTLFSVELSFFCLFFFLQFITGLIFVPCDDSIMDRETFMRAKQLTKCFGPAEAYYKTLARNRKPSLKQHSILILASIADQCTTLCQYQKSVLKPKVSWHLRPIRPPKAHMCRLI